MSREILILWAGRHHRRPWEELCAGYRRRIARHVPVRDQRIKVKARGDKRTRRRAESEALLAALPDPCWTVALDPRGHARTSEAFAAELGRLEREWPHPVAFLIGSDVGLDRELLSQTRERLALGPMVFGHELARLVLYEQLYRSMAILRGINYHRQPL